MFSQDIFDLEDESFEGTNEELRISQEVFYGNTAADFSEKIDIAEVTRSLNEHEKISPSSHSENSAITNQASSKDICESNPASAELQRDFQALSSTEGSNMDERVGHDVHAKRMRYAVSELSTFKPYLDRAVASSIPLKQVVSEACRPVELAPCQILMCHVVESCSEGVTSSCYVLNQYPESDREGNLGDTSAVDGSLSGSDGSEVKQVGCSNSIASPISQESSATKLLVPSPTTVAVSEPGSLERPNKRPKTAIYSECKDDDDERLTGDRMKDAHFVLRSRVHILLERAGWSPERHVRNDGRNRNIYLSPEGKRFREFAKVWDLIGHSLSAHDNNKVTHDDKQWTNVDQFCSDLYETLEYIDKTMNDWEPKCSLVCQWSLLDPFVNVVLVNRKIHALRAGKLVEAKANQSNLTDMRSKVKSRKAYRKVSQGRHGEKFSSGSAAFDMMETHKTRSIYVSEGNSLRLVKTIADNENCNVGPCTDENMNANCLLARVSDSTGLHHPNDLYDVPLGAAETKAIYKHPSHHQASCISSPSCNKQSCELSKENSKDSAVCLLEQGAEPSERFSADVGVNKMDCRYEGSTGQELYDGSSQLKAVDVQGWSINSVENDNSDKFPTCLFEHHSGHKSTVTKQSHQSKYDGGFCSVEPNVVTDTDKLPHEYNGSIESQSYKKGTRRKKYNSSKKRKVGCRLKDDDLLISAIIKKRSFKSSITDCGREPGKFKSRSLKKRKTQKGSCRLLLRSSGKGGKQVTDRWTLIGERTILAWLISAGSLFINETVQYRDPKEDVVVKEGHVAKNGILCNCCSEVFSVSKFKTHAGFNQNRPCLNLFVGSGRPYTLCQLQAWSAEYKVRRSCTRYVPLDEFDKNDDSCGLCGDGGELLCCDNCPSTFHQSCLAAEDLPEGSWYCPNCTCQICGALATTTEISSSHAALKCSQCDKKYHQMCLTNESICEVGDAPWFCGAGCEEVFSGLQSRIGMSNEIADGYSWTLLRCIHDDQKVSSAQRFALKAECNSKLSVAVTIMEECFLSMIDPRTGIDMIPQVVYNWGSDFSRLDYHGFYTAVLEKDDVLISVASIRVHGAAVAEMPLIATCSKFRRQGMCRRLLNSIEKMLISLKVEKLVIAAIADLVETWTIGFGFVPMDEDEKKSLSKINLMVFPGTVMLKKTLYVDQTTDLQTGGEDLSTLRNDEAPKVGTFLEGDPEADSIYRYTEEDSLNEVLNEPKLQLITYPDMETSEVQNSTSACEVKSQLLEGLGSLEPENGTTNVMIEPMKEELSYVPVACKMETNDIDEINSSEVVTTHSNVVGPAQDNITNVIEPMKEELSHVPAASKRETNEIDEINTSEVLTTHSDVVGPAQDSIMKVTMEPMKEELSHVPVACKSETEFDEINTSNTSEVVTAHLDVVGPVQDSITNVIEPMKEELSHVPVACKLDTNEIDEINTSNTSEVLATHSDVVGPAQDSIMNVTIETMEEELSNVPVACRSETEFDEINTSEVVTTHLVAVDPVQEDQKAAVEVTEICTEPTDHVEPLDGVISSGKTSSDQFCEYDVPLVIQEGVSGEETRSVCHAVNQLSVIEQSQQASVLPETQLN